MQCQYENHREEHIVGVCLNGCRVHWCCARCQTEKHQSHIVKCKTFAQLVTILEGNHEKMLIQLREQKQNFETIKQKYEKMLKEFDSQAKQYEECIVLLKNQHYKDPIVENMIQKLTRVDQLPLTSSQNKEFTSISDHIFKLSQSLFDEGKLKEASTYLKFSEKFDPNYNVLLAKGLCLVKLSRLEKATRIFDKLINLSPNNYTPYLLKATTLRKRRLYNEALTTLGQWNNIKAITEKGIILYKLNQTKEALEIFNQVIETDPKSELPYFYKAKCLIKAKRLDEAKETYKLLLKTNPQCGLGYCILGLMQYGQQNYKEALQNLIESVKYNPTNQGKMLQSIVGTQMYQTKIN